MRALWSTHVSYRSSLISLRLVGNGLPFVRCFKGDLLTGIVRNESRLVGRFKHKEGVATVP